MQGKHCLVLMISTDPSSGSRRRITVCIREERNAETYAENICPQISECLGISKIMSADFGRYGVSEVVGLDES